MFNFNDFDIVFTSPPYFEWACATCNELCRNKNPSKMCKVLHQRDGCNLWSICASKHKSNLVWLITYSFLVSLGTSDTFVSSVVPVLFHFLSSFFVTLHLSQKPIISMYNIPIFNTVYLVWYKQNITPTRKKIHKYTWKLLSKLNLL